MKVLSIDFDFFVDCDIETRETKFPDGVDNLPTKECEIEWGLSYRHFPEIADIGVIKSYDTIMSFLRLHTFKKVVCADSHRGIWEVLTKIPSDEIIELEHVDFHHDNYISGASNVDCANWVRHLMERRPNTEIHWVRREDSAVSSLSGDFPYEHDEYFRQRDYDIVFLCFSPEWTPPHLRSKYEAMTLTAKENSR